MVLGKVLIPPIPPLSNDDLASLRFNEFHTSIAVSEKARCRAFNHANIIIGGLGSFGRNSSLSRKRHHQIKQASLTRLASLAADRTLLPIWHARDVTRAIACAPCGSSQFESLTC